MESTSQDVTPSSFLEYGDTSPESVLVLNPMVSELVHTAPLTVIKNMEHHIRGSNPAEMPTSPASNALSLGLISEGLCDVLLHG